MTKDSNLKLEQKWEGSEQTVNWNLYSRHRKHTQGSQEFQFWFVNIFVLSVWNNDLYIVDIDEYWLKKWKYCENGRHKKFIIKTTWIF